MASRKERAFIQNIYLLHMVPSDNEYIRNFKVVGTTRNIYDVSIKEKPSCTCKDYENGNICKHIYFIMLRVMRIIGDVKNNYSKEELLELFENIPDYINIDLLYDDVIIDDKIEEKNVPQKFDDMCPVCLDDITNETPELDYCKYGCGKSVHNKCFQIWNNTNPYGQNKCLFCRIDWIKEEKTVNNNHRGMRYDVNDLDGDSEEDDEESVTWDDSETDDSEDSDSECSCGHYDIVIDHNIIVEQYDDVKTQLNNLTVVQLRELCRENGLSVSGNKASLVERLNGVFGD